MEKFNLGDTVHVQNTKTQTPLWKDTIGTVVQILSSTNASTQEEVSIYIIKAKNGTTCPMESCYLSRIV